MAKKGVAQNSGVEKNIGLVLGGGASAVAGSKIYKAGSAKVAAGETIGIKAENMASTATSLSRKGVALGGMAADHLSGGGEFSAPYYNGLQADARNLTVRGGAYNTAAGRMAARGSKIARGGKIMRGAGTALAGLGLGAMFAGLVTDFNSAKSAASDSVKAQSARIKNARKK